LLYCCRPLCGYWFIDYFIYSTNNQIKNMSLARLIEVRNHHISCFYTVNRLRCVLELILFSSCSRDHCDITLLSLHFCLATRYVLQLTVPTTCSSLGYWLNRYNTHWISNHIEPYNNIAIYNSTSTKQSH